MSRITHRLAALVAIAIVVGAVTPTWAEHHEADSGFSADFVADLQRVGGRLVELAEAMPADKYSWSPGEGVRSVSEVYMHVVGVNIFMPVGLGAAPPEDVEMPENPMAMLQDLEANVTTKTEVVERLKASFEYAAETVPTITDLETEVDLFGFPGSKRAYLLIMLTHAHEHLGQSIAYARSNGVVPPWSQQQASGDGG
jgi:uncharacterized damage-inducible protein DinB